MTQRDIVRLANSLMAEHLSGMGWTFALNTNKRRRGVCKFQQTVMTPGQPDRIIPIKRIELSVHLLKLANPDFEVRNTLLHEIAHALVGLGHHHDDVWRATARRIGCTGTTCGDDMGVKPNYIGRCPKCPVEIKRFRVKASMLATAYHPSCGKDAKIVWSKA